MTESPSATLDIQQRAIAALGSALLEVTDSRQWTLTLRGHSTVLSQPYTLHVALDIASRLVEEKFDVTDVRWADPDGPRAYSGRFIIDSWTWPDEAMP